MKFHEARYASCPAVALLAARQGTQFLVYDALLVRIFRQ